MEIWLKGGMFLRFCLLEIPPFPKRDSLHFGPREGNQMRNMRCFSRIRSIQDSPNLRFTTVTTPADVQLAIDHGVDGIIVSNHGGRQLDGMPATLDLLRDCVPLARGRIQLAMDGGIRRGSDIFKALALGAQFVLVGRIPIWGLAVS